MKFRQLATGTILETNHPDTVEIFLSSGAYAVVEDAPKPEPRVSAGKTASAKDGKSAGK